MKKKEVCACGGGEGYRKGLLAAKRSIQILGGGEEVMARDFKTGSVGVFVFVSLKVLMKAGMV